MVFTLDALHTTPKTAQLITDDLHAHYLLLLKDNQPLTLPWPPPRSWPDPTPTGPRPAPRR
jgi:hypothetical protein